MLRRLQQARLIWPTVATLVASGILLTFGNWQMRRKAWKEDLIATVKAQAASDPVSLRAVLDSDLTTQQFRRVTLTGTFQHASEFHVWAPQPRQPAWSVITPFQLTEPLNKDQRYPTSIVLVMRGVVPEASKASATRGEGQPAAPVTLTGRVRLGGVGVFDGKPDVVKNQWYANDLTAMRLAMAGQTVARSASGVPDQAISRVAPFFVEAEAAAPGKGAPEPRLGALALSNRHLEYALTWYALAATLIGVYFAFAAARLRNDKHRSENK